VLLHRFSLQVGGQDREALPVWLDAAAKKAMDTAEEHYPHIEKLAPLHTRHHTNNRVIK
jgi:hypothetical protein